MDIQFSINEAGKGAFFVEKDGKRLAEMVIGISGENLTVYHTEVSNELKGQGVASKLLTAMVEYTRMNNLKVIPLCPFVQAQFKKHPQDYADVWKQNWHA